MKDIRPAKIPDFLSGGGQMGERIRNLDWSKTPLGDPENWDQGLKTSVSICLNSNFPIALYWGEELALIYNDAWSPIPGNKHPWALGRTAKEVWKDIWAEIEPEFKKAFEGIPGGSKDALLPMQRHGYIEECYFDFTFTPVRAANGKIEGIFNAVIETTYRILSERRSNFLNNLSVALTSAHTQEKVFEIFNEFLKQNNNPVSFAFFYADNDGSPKLFAATDSNGIKLNKPFPFKDVSEEKKIHLIKNIREYLKEVPKGYWKEEPVEAVILPITDLNEKVSHYIICGLNARRRYDEDYKSFFQSVIHIVTKIINTIFSLEEERKRAETLEELDKAKTIFFSNISHEFRTPLTLMLGTLEEVLKDEITAEENLQRLEITHRNAMRLLKLVNTLLDFSRIESGRQKGNFAPVDLGSFTKNLTANFESIVEKAGLNFNVEINAINQAVYVDKSMWEKIVFNLLSNAFKYTLDGSITIRLFSKDDTVVFEVEDTGVGIPEKELPHMFERFHRVQNIVGRTYEGTGIGLSLIKELVQLHKGTVSVRSQEGKGSCFSVKLPFGKEHLPEDQIGFVQTEIESSLPNIYIDETTSLLDDAQAKSFSDINDNEPLTINKPPILVVDDNADMRRHIKSVLQKQYRIITAANGLDALIKIKSEKPLLVLSDIMMPVMDGIELIKQIKNDQQTAQLPVILLTARAGEESRVEGFETGADDYLVKPFAANELIARVKAQIHIAKMRAAVEEKLRSFLMQAPAAIAIVEGPEFRFTVANQRYQKLFARTKEQLIGYTIKEAFPEVEEQNFYGIFTNVLESAEPFMAHEFPITLKEDEEIKTGYYDFVIHPIKDNEDHVNDLMIVAFEVTESVTARKKIEESEERFRTLANEAPLFVWLTDKNLQTTFLNETGLHYFNVDVIKGLSWKNFIHPDDIERVLNVMDDAAVKHKSYTLEMRLKNGATGEYHWFLDKGVPRYDGNEFIGYIGTSLDIDDRKRSEKILQESEARFRTLTEALPQLVLMTDAKGVQQFASKSWIDYAGLIPQGEIWLHIIHPDDIMRVGESWINNLQIGKTYKVELRLKNKQGEYRWHFGQGEPIRDKDGNIINWIGAFTDIHDRKTFADKLEAEVAQRTFELERSNKELESFNYIASHDLQEPLRKIQTFILLLEKSLTDEETSRKYINKITTSAQRMSQLIQSVLDYSRLSQTNAAFETTDLNDILENVKSDYELLITEKNAVINNNKLPVIKANPLQMQQLFSNLISNSLKFSEERPVINITSRIVTGKDVSVPGEINKKQKFAEIRFADNGIGFEQQYSEQIFKLFQRLHNKSEYSGTGVGLSIVSKIVEGHNGFVKAESPNNKGAIFTLWFPFN
ncbi:MAG: PAS domain S-box protein [Parafilimonas sp.]|nr:PAS domain S-box protein [Parafilimonas sp.]